MQFRTPDLPKQTFALSGWGSPRPVLAEFASRAEIEVCRAIIAGQIDFFRQPLLKLEATIGTNAEQVALVERHKARPHLPVRARRAPALEARPTLFAPLPPPPAGGHQRSVVDAATAEWLFDRVPKGGWLIAVGRETPASVFGIKPYCSMSDTGACSPAREMDARTGGCRTLASGG